MLADGDGWIGTVLLEGGREEYAHRASCGVQARRGGGLRCVLGKNDQAVKNT